MGDIPYNGVGRATCCPIPVIERTPIVIFMGAFDQGGLSMKPFVLDRNRAQLLMIDIQEKLCPAMYNRERICRNTGILLEAANLLKLPVKVTEQYPRGLGGTVGELEKILPSHTHKFEKVHFSCYSEPGFHHFIQQAGRSQVVVAGIESHICVLATVLEMLRDNYDVAVVADATGSRKRKHHVMALDAMGQAGAFIVPMETAVFQLLGQSGTPEFKSLLRHFK